VNRAEELRDAGRDVLVIALAEKGHEADLEASFPRLLASRESGSITVIVVTPFADGPDNVWDELQAPWDAQIALDKRRAVQRLFPAIDPVRTRSRALDPAAVGARHVKLAEAARAQLELYEATDPELALPDPAGFDDPATATRVQALLRHLAQPFRTTEPFTGQPGERIDRGQMLGEIAEFVSR